MLTQKRFPSFLMLLFLTAPICLAAGDAPEGGKLAAQKLELAKLQSFVGTWKGGGQTKRGSNDGAWVEQTDWVWKFSDQSASLTFTSEKAKYVASGSVRPGSKAGEFQLTTKSAKDGSETEYVGNLAEDGQVVFVADKAPADQPDRISMRTVANGDRLVVMYEKKSTISDRLARMAEVGYTRKGSQFGQTSDPRECIVTGGVGTMAVTHKNQTYYVCCTGCRDMFNENPEKTIAEFVARKAAEKAKKAQ